MGMEHTHGMGSEHIPERAPEILPQNLEMGTMKPWNGFDWLSVLASFPGPNHF